MPNPRPLVAVVEDSIVVRSVLAQHLADRGYEAIEACDGEEALRLFEERPPDVVLLDVNMPGMSGYEVLDEMKRTPALEKIPVIILTVRQSAEDAIRGLELGAHDYLRKPVQPVELAVRVASALRLKNAQDELLVRNVELEHISRTDFLTGLPNRRHIDDELKRACSASRRHGRQLGLLVIDIDHFKQVNDLAGHAAGDAVLREVAWRLRTALRPEDTAGRWGGDEFLVILPDTGADGIKAAAGRLADAMHGRGVDIGSGRDLPVQISIGGAVYQGGDPTDLLRDADRALYQAKQTPHTDPELHPTA
ncbi:MAG: diguanylate cyclase [Actinobacteria bacterium]|nr:diguanylate cyclase [Actinomycetota bacterium]MBV9664911.1 diguanylate cyclase [Actinomycetota bacterium]